MKNSVTANAVYKRQSEYSKKAFEKGNLMPRRYVFVLTNLCNLKCTFCFQERKKRPDRMSTENWLNVIDQIPEKSRITLTGGEPLVFQDFDKIFSKANNIAETNIVTNGLLLSNQKIEQLNTILSRHRQTSKSPSMHVASGSFSYKLMALLESKT